MLGEEYNNFSVEFNPPVTFRFKDERFFIKEEDLPALIFGSIEKKIEVPEYLPMIKKIFQILFPIPLVDYGLNYT
jgi:hypothetical protein